jgi:hypothetical protein
MPFDPLWLLVLVPLALAVAVFIVMKRKEKSDKADTIRSLERIADVAKENGKYIMTTENGTYPLVFFNVPSQGELTVNSLKVFEIVTFRQTIRVDTDGLFRSGDNTLIVVYPSLHPIKRYINENEMVFTSVQKPFSGIRIGTLAEIESVIKKGTL